MLKAYSPDGPNPFEDFVNILHLPHGYWPATGGAEHLTRGWSEGLADRGHTVQVSVADLATPEGLYRFGIETTRQIDEAHNAVTIRRIQLDAVYRIGGAMFRRDPYAPGRIGSRLRQRIRAHLKNDLRREIERFQPDIVLTLPHVFENVRIVFELRREMGFPLVWGPLLHEADPNWPFDEVSRLVESTDALIALTSSEADRLVSRYGASAERVHIVPPCIAAPGAIPDASSDSPTILYLGRMSRSKGIDVLPSAMATVWSHRPETQLVLAGAATPDLREIQAGFDRIDKPAEHSVEFHTDVTEDEKQRLLRSATALVLPSERESFGIVLLEAWATATPVIAVDSPVFRDTVDNGVDGVLVPARHSDAFAAAILKLVEDPGKSRQMGIAGFMRLPSEYSKARVSMLLEDVYSSAIARVLEHPA